MKILASFLSICFLCLTVLSQSTNTKKTPAKAKPKTAASSQQKKSSGSKPASKTAAAGKSAPKLSAVKATTAKKPTSTPASKAKAQPGKTIAAQKKPAAKTKAEPVDEETAWGKVNAVSVPSDRVTELRKFIAAYPDGKHHADAVELLAYSIGETATDKLATGDVAAAAELYKDAAKEAPAPISSRLFDNMLSKVPANLYFRGARDQALEIQHILESKAQTDAGQLLSLAAFYMSIESGDQTRRLADAAIKIDPNSSTAYETMGLGYRMDFMLDESAAAFAKALELKPDSLSARRGLAEMKRSLGRSEEAIPLYKEILDKDQQNLPAETGYILSMFEAGKRTDAEAEMNKSLEANPGNVILLAGAAYWYAAHNEGDRAVDLAQKAIAADPRFIWSHVALARGLMLQRKPVDAERVLLAARRYGNFPTLNYEIASARMAAGFYRDAAESLAKNFSISDGVIKTDLGGRVPRESKYFTELVGFERRASIFAPTAADSPENASRLAALLEFYKDLNAADPKPDKIGAAADDFVRGDDKMRVHRELFAATQLLDKKIAPEKSAELAKDAISGVDTALDVPAPTAAVMAGALYESRSLADLKGEFVTMPDVPKATLQAIVRGRVEDLTGRAKLQAGDTDEAIVHFKRAVAVTPGDSVWWRQSAWSLASALESKGSKEEALDFYIRSYKSGDASPMNYATIENLYRQVNGSVDGLEAKIGAKPGTAEIPAPIAELSSTSKPPRPNFQFDSGAPQPGASMPAVVPAETEPSAEAKAEDTLKPSPSPEALTVPSPSPTAEAKSPDVSPAASPSPLPEPTLAPDKATVPESSPSPVPSPENDSSKSMPAAVPASPEASPAAVPVNKDQQPAAEPTASPATEATPSSNPKDKPAPEPSTSPAPEPSATPSATPDAAATPSPTPEPVPSASPVAEASTTAPPETQKPSEHTERVDRGTKPAPTVVVEDKTFPPSPASQRPTLSSSSSLFPPVVIAIPAADNPEKIAKPTPDDGGSTVPLSETAARQKARPRFAAEDVGGSAKIAPCKLNVSDESITLQKGSGDLGVMVSVDEGQPIDALSARSSSPLDVKVRREKIDGLARQALFIVSSASSRSGIYQIRFEMPCGYKTMMVRVK